MARYYQANSIISPELKIDIWIMGKKEGGRFVAELLYCLQGICIALHQIVNTRYRQSIVKSDSLII